ncbi:Glucose-methanol-choline (GMC) oxidoreductase family protein [Zostera marina]|uniref:Glucose-methanol-choline (GMC) oxidoreductase family protein n=1 Tax=Zostera marina TaxID=29655 RepID=A0A0K9P5D5_ZOSMR|nr:Glucose-methanol-choline (GMC) oxidoreductase family protein [Zostera marina]
MRLRLSSFRCCLLGIFYFVGFCHSIRDFEEQGGNSGGMLENDYIIVGGGAAGCSLAATLSQKYRVLLIERGGSPYGNPNIENMENFVNNLLETSVSSPSQVFISEDGVLNNRGRVLGGSTAINAGFYSRASTEYIARAGWNLGLVNESYRWVEDVVAYEPVLANWQSAMMDGLIEVGVTPDNGFTYQHMYGTKVGGTIFDQNGTRHTAADLLRNYADHQRLTVILNATVTEILFRSNNENPSAYGIVYRDLTGARSNHSVYLKEGGKGEIIVCAGAIGSPQLLMLSGIGPKKQLEKLGINVILDQPIVGQNISDVPMNAVFVPSPSPVDVSLVQVAGITHQDTYIEALSGLYIPGYTYDGPLPNNNSTSATFSGGLFVEKIKEVKSRGSLELLTINPDDNPKVRYNYLSNPSDLRKCVEGMRIIEKTIESKSFARFKYPSISALDTFKSTAMAQNNPNATTSFQKFCKETVSTIWHYHGGCEVDHVVDRDYKVIGVDALRVVDGSTFHFSPGTNPQATVMMLGRYVGVNILQQTK